jgi:glycosyltransferase involved in cell wall biosynthesis
MNTPILGVCIPTYRRPDQLRRCVDSIVRSSGANVVPIHIADDSVDDTNVSVIAELKARYPHIVHHRNPKNLGIDLNILHCVDLCEARHAWIMGEDDRMVPEAISTVLDTLGRGDHPFVFVNYASVDEAMTLVLRERSLALDADREMSAEEFLASDAWSMGFIGACVVDKNAWRTVRPALYIGTYFAHVGTAMEYLRGRTVYLIARPLVLNRCGTARTFTWTGSTFDVLNGWGRMVNGLRSHYPADVCDRAVEAFRRAHGVGSVRFFCYLRADKALDPEIYERFVRRGSYPAVARLAAWWIARTPAALFETIRSCVWALRRRFNRRITGY